MAAKELVVVTGGSGYIASWVCKKLVESGYHVRTTCRSKGPTKTDHLEAMGVEVVDGCDLNVEGSFDKAIEGAKYIHHMASPFFFSPPEDCDGTFFTIPAVNGTKNVLNAAKKAGTVKRFIVTSSCAAVTWAEPQNHPDGYAHIWNEDDWQQDNTLEKGPYRLSKRLAEEECYKFKDSFEIVAICPAFVLGPSLSARTDATSVMFQKSLIDGSVTECKPMKIGGVDVRDVAQAHVLAQTVEDLGSGNKFGQHRFILSNEVPLSLLDYAKIAKQVPELAGYPIPTKESSPPGENFVTYSHTRTTKVLGLKWTPIEETIKDGLLSLIEKKVVSPPS